MIAEKPSFDLWRCGELVGGRTSRGSSPQNQKSRRDNPCSLASLILIANKRISLIDFIDIHIAATDGDLDVKLASCPHSMVLRITPTA
jgi:hypothetical protein